MSVHLKLKQMNFMNYIIGYYEMRLKFKNILFLLIISLLSLFIYVYTFIIKDEVFHSKDIEPLPLDANAVFSQQIPYKKIVLSDFSLRFGTYMRKNFGELSVSFYDNGVQIDNWSIPTENLRDNAFQVFKLQKPIKMSKNHSYELKISVNYLNNNNVALYIVKTPFFHYTYGCKNHEGSAEFQYGGYSCKQIFRVILFIATLFVLYFSFTFSVNHKIITYLVFFFVGLAYVFIFPNGSAPDENGHFYRAFEISEGKLISKKIEAYPNQVGNFLPISLSDYKDKNATISAQRAYINFANTALYSPLSYIPQALGIKVASIFTDNVSKIFTCGRIFNFLTCYLLCICALHFMPFAKNLLFIIIMLPITLQEIGSLAVDGFILSLVLFFLSYTLHLCYVKPKVCKRDIIILLSLSILISLCKIVYLVVLPVIYLIPKSKIEKNKLFVYFFIPFIAIVCNFIWLYIASDFLIEFNVGVNSSEQFKYILHHPLDYFFIFIKSIFVNGLFVLESAFGHFLGALTISTHPLLWICFFVVFVYALTQQNIDSKIQINNFHRWVFLAIFLIGIVGIYTALYIQWTPLKSTFIDGVQGRYLLPLLTFLGLFVIYLNHKNISIQTNRDSRYLYAFLLFLNEIAFLDIMRSL